MISTVLTDLTVPLNCMTIGTAPRVTSATITWGGAGAAAALDSALSSQPCTSRSRLHQKALLAEPRPAMIGRVIGPSFPRAPGAPDCSARSFGGLLGGARGGRLGLPALPQALDHVVEDRYHDDQDR